MDLGLKREKMVFHFRRDVVSQGLKYYSYYKKMLPPMVEAFFLSQGSARRMA